MKYEENEDPEDRVERLNREGLIRRLQPVVVRSAWVSFVATTLGLAMWISPLILDWNVESSGRLYCFSVLILSVGQGATVLTYVRIVRLKLAGLKGGYWKPVLLALPGIIISTLIAVSMMGMAFLIKSRA